MGIRMPTGITWDPLLADRIVRGLSLGVLGQIALPEPLARLVVLGRSDGPPQAQLSLAATLVPTASGGTVVLSPFGLGRPGATRIPEELTERFDTRALRGGGFFVLDAAGGDRFLVAPGLMRHVTVTCGVWPVLRQIIGPSAPARPTTDTALVADDLDRFCELVEAVIAATYDAQDLPAPPLDLTLRVTGTSVEGALGGLRKLTSTLARIPGGNRAPGEVYDPTSGGGAEEATTFADVGGQDVARAELETICLAVERPDAFRAWGARPPRGVLLYGPPGTGKTMLARALAHEAGARFLHVRATDLVSKWYGEAEQRVQQAFDRARAETPAVIFFDEIDAVARDRSVSHEATHRMVSTFLENMDGLRETEGVIVLAATNRPESVDEALLRPGRFDRLVEVPLPNRAGRQAIFGVHMRRAERVARRSLFAEPDEAQWSALLDATDGFSGADVAEVVRRALEAKVRSRATAGRIEPDELLAVATGIARKF